MSDRELFLDYYFNDGCEADQEYTLLALGEMVRAQLFESGTATINVQQLEEGSDMNDFYDWVHKQNKI